MPTLPRTQELSSVESGSMQDLGHCAAPTTDQSRLSTHGSSQDASSGSRGQGMDTMLHAVIIPALETVSRSTPGTM